MVSFDFVASVLCNCISQACVDLRALTLSSRVTERDTRTPRPAVDVDVQGASRGISAKGLRLARKVSSTIYKHRCIARPLLVQLNYIGN